MKNKELKIKMWAVSGILESFTKLGIDPELSQEEIMKMLGLIGKVYENKLGLKGEEVSNALREDANLILRELLDELLQEGGSNSDANYH